MPVAIACPKCQTRYSLPDQALGKPVKCKSCGTVFKTKAPAPKSPANQAAPQRPTQPPAQRPAPVSNPELAKFGIDGPISRPADIFAGTSAPPPQMGNPLGNFVLEDPGFADLNVVQEEIQEEMGGEDGMSAILNNPYMNMGKESNRARRRGKSVDVSGYSVARTGMSLVHGSWATMLGITVLLFVLGTFVRFVPEETLRSIVQALGESFYKVFMKGVTFVFWLWAISVLGIFVGQILCIFAPNKDEKLFAGLSLGSILGAVTQFFVIVILRFVGWDSDSDTQAFLGLVILLLIVGIYAMSLLSMFFFITYFKRVGKNIRAKDVVEASRVALLTWIAAMAIGIISGVAVGILTAVYGPAPGEDPSQFILNVRDASGLLNIALAIAVMGTLLVMIKSAVDHTKPD